MVVIITVVSLIKVTHPHVIFFKDIACKMGRIKNDSIPQVGIKPTTFMSQTLFHCATIATVEHLYRNLF